MRKGEGRPIQLFPHTWPLLCLHPYIAFFTLARRGGRKSRRNRSCCLRGQLERLSLLLCPAKHRKVSGGKTGGYRKSRKMNSTKTLHHAESPRPHPSGFHSSDSQDWVLASILMPSEIICPHQSSVLWSRKCHLRKRLSSWKPAFLQQWEPKKGTHHPAYRNEKRQV